MRNSAAASFDSLWCFFKVTFVSQKKPLPPELDWRQTIDSNFPKSQLLMTSFIVAQNTSDTHSCSFPSLVEMLELTNFSSLSHKTMSNYSVSFKHIRKKCVALNFPIKVRCCCLGKKSSRRNGEERGSIIIIFFHIKTLRKRRWCIDLMLKHFFLFFLGRASWKKKKEKENKWLMLFKITMTTPAVHYQPPPKVCGLACAFLCQADRRRGCQLK